MITVTELVGALGSGILRIVTMTSGERTQIGGVVVADPSMPLEVGQDDLVIGIGVVPGPAAVRLLTRLAGAGAAGLVARESVARELAGEAARRRVTLLGMPAGTQWARVIHLVSSVVSPERFGISPGEELPGSILAAVSEPLSPLREASLLEAVLEGGPLAVEAAVRLHLVGLPVAVVAAAPEADPELVEGLLPRLRDLLSLHLSIERRVPAAVVGSTAYSLVPLPALTDRVDGALIDALRRLVEHSQWLLRARVLIGVGSIVASAAAAADSRAHAEAVIRVLRAGGCGGVAEIGDVSSRALLLEVSNLLHGDPGLLLRPIRLLQQHDLENNTDHLATLAAYLRAFGSIGGAAQQLRVHANTVRYRLRQIQNLTGVLLTDPDERLALELQLHLLARRGAPEPARLPGSCRCRTPVVIRM